MSLSCFDYSRGVVYIPGTKTLSSDRYIPFFSGLKLLIEDMRSHGLLVADGLIFPFREDRVTKRFRSLCPYHKLHDLRHTFASVAFSRGVPLKIVQAWLGHANIKTTADTYVHLSFDSHISEAVKLDGAFDPCFDP
jgi:integrase